MVKPARNLALNLLLFCCTASAVAVAASTGSDPNTTLAVRTLRGYLMVVSVSINEHGPLDFLVDTGSNTTVIEPELAAERSLKPTARLRLSFLRSATAV